jgi:HD-GYP domain-containing protein (c-di-GMP phosphodiesterase class II)
MLPKWFGKRKAETAPHNDVESVFNTQSDFEDFEMSQVDILGLIEEDSEVSEDKSLDLGPDNKLTLHSSPLENKPVSVWGPVLATLIPLGAFVALIAAPSYDHNHMLMHLHFNVVSLVAFLAAGISVLVGVAGSRLRNIQVLLVAMAFISLGTIFGLHGVTTPGILMEKNQVVEMAAPLSILLTVIWLYLSSLPTSHALIRRLAKVQNYLIPAWTGLMMVVSGVLFYQPQLAELLPLHSNPLRFVVALVTLELTVMTAWNFWHSYSYTRAPLQLAIVYSSAWLAVSTIIMGTGKAWNTSWWLYHGLLLAAVMVMMVGLIVQYNRGRNLALALIGKGHKDPVGRLEAAISPGVRQLIKATEQHDSYTAGHNHRVAVIAVQMGEQMGLSSGELRALAQGGIVHDLGKLEVPSEILNKPGKLEADERELIETHPMQGYHLAKRLGFMPQELDIIRYHHERWDGAGYPDKLAKEDIPLLARITAVADVYDALTSERAYRKPWSHEQTRTHILGQTGFQFDPACVEAWDKIHQAVTEEEVSLMTVTTGAVA